MGEETDKIKQCIISAFPKLGDDPFFKLTSKATPDYNCIAWAYNISDKWMWPNTGEFDFFDGLHYWPTSEKQLATIPNFVAAFRLKGYELCDDYEHEEGYQKVALYAKPGSDECTHASREMTNGYWTSKLGTLQDIQHGNPTTVESQLYGEVRCIMKRVFK